MRLLPTLSFFARHVSQAREILRALVRPTGSRSSVRGRFIAQPRVVTQVIARLLGGITWKAGKLVLTSNAQSKCSRDFVAHLQKFKLRSTSRLS